MRQITTEELKQRGVEVLEPGDQAVEIVRDGQVVARLSPAQERGPQAHLIGCLKGKLHIKGDIFSTGIEWDAHR